MTWGENILFGLFFMSLLLGPPAYFMLLNLGVFGLISFRRPATLLVIPVLIALLPLLWLATCFWLGMRLLKVFTIVMGFKEPGVALPAAGLAAALFLGFILDMAYNIYFVPEQSTIVDVRSVRVSPYGDRFVIEAKVRRKKKYIFLASLYETDEEWVSVPRTFVDRSVRVSRIASGRHLDTQCVAGVYRGRRMEKVVVWGLTLDDANRIWKQLTLTGPPEPFPEEARVYWDGVSPETILRRCAAK